jgi:phospholipid transport system substrate-binding protein
MNACRASNPVGRVWLWLVLLAAPALAAQEAAPAAAAPAAGTPLAVVRTAVDGVIALLQDRSLSEESRKRQVKALIGQHFDYAAMANRVLATNWSKATKSQRARFTALFRELLSNTYWRKISGYTNERVEYLGERARGDRLATVNTMIKTDTVDIPVDYKLYLRGDTWLAYDVVIEQVSLVRNYRGSFQDIVRDEGIDGLISVLETKVAESSVEEP